MKIKLSIYNSVDGEENRQNINDLISSLVRVGYEVYLSEGYICFDLGVDDKVEEE